MTFSALADAVRVILRGDKGFPVYPDFDNLPLKENAFAVCGISGIRPGAPYRTGEDSGYACTVDFRITLFGKNASSVVLLSAGEEMLGRLLASELCIAEVQAQETTFNTKLNRTQYTLLFTLSGRFQQGDFHCVENKSFAGIAGRSFQIHSLSLEREKILTQTPLLGKGVYTSVSGPKNIRLTLKGYFLREDAGILSWLEEMLSDESELQVELSGREFHQMHLTGYRFLQEKEEPLSLCEITFMGAEDGYE